MKTKLLLTSLLSFSFYLLSSQVPQGFNYQAIARDGSGNPITGATMQVKIGILSDTIMNTMVWEELFNPVKTNAFGMFTVVVGTGVRQSGSASSFSTIDWTKTPLFIRTSLCYPSVWKLMGTTKLQSVPYSMVAGNLEGTVPLLSIKGNTAVMDSALFVVRNNTGQIVFAVYNEGVRIYVDDGKTKGNKGGFAIGGFGTGKATSQPFLVVDHDSIRMYINDVLSKGNTKGGFAIGGFGTNKGLPSNFFNVATDTMGIINPSQNRILWYPLKNAFLTGNIIIENKDSVGINSFSSGYISRAKGAYSQAMGFRAIARANYSTAIGRYSLSNGSSSYAFGEHSTATGTGAYALGSYATASGNQSFALGSVGVDTLGNPTGKTIASGFGAFAAGFGSVASAQGSFTFGVADTASGPFSTAMGYETVAKGYYNTSMGLVTKADGVASTATGWGSQVKSAGWGGMANGCLTTSNNWVAAAFGDRTMASGHTSFATGYNTVASGHLSSTFGEYTTASGDGTTAFGHYTTAWGNGSVSMGYHNNAQAYASLVIGQYNAIAGTSNTWNSLDPAFVIGNGSSDAARSNALTVFKSGSADFSGSVNLMKGSTGAALYVNGDQALWYNGTYYSWGYDGTYNVFARKTSIGTTGSPGSYSLYVVGNALCSGTWGTSDIRWKKNLVPVTNVVPDLLVLNAYRYNWRSDEFPDMHFDKATHIGLIAQEVEKVFPELVNTDDNGFKAVSYEKLSAILLQGMKEQQQQIDAQKRENEELRTEIYSLKEEVRQIRSALSGNQ